VTGVKKFFVLFALQVGLLGAAFGGGYYLQLQKNRAQKKQMDEVQKKAKQDEEAWQKALLGSRSRTQLLEAALAVEHQNYGMAFDRLIRTQLLTGRMGLPLERDIQEISLLLTKQKPESLGKLLNLADKIEPAPAFNLPFPQAKGAEPPAKPAASPALPAASPALPAAAPPPPAAPATDAAPVKAVRDSTAERYFQDGREALLQAKENLLSGSESVEIVKKLARSQVLLEESGYSEVDDELAVAIKAAKSHDEARLRTALDSALKRLRAR
jgi:hypothetical protein